MTETDPMAYAGLISQLHDLIKHHEREARKARTVLTTVKNLIGSDPTRSRKGGGSGISRAEVGRENRERVLQYFADNPGTSMWAASKALELTYNTVMRHVHKINDEAPGVLDVGDPARG